MITKRLFVHAGDDRHVARHAPTTAAAQLDDETSRLLGADRHADRQLPLVHPGFKSPLGLLPRGITAAGIERQFFDQALEAGFLHHLAKRRRLALLQLILAGEDGKPSEPARE